MRRLSTVALLGRDTGLSVLADMLVGHPRLDVVGVFTHGRLTRAEGGGTRPELAGFEAVTGAAGIPLTVLDYPEAKRIEDYLPAGGFDLMVCLSWRFILTRTALEKARVAAVNLHRGALPAYAGAEPVKRALLAGDTRLAITAHHMIDEVDAGDEIARVWIDAPPLRAGDDVDAAVARAKRALVPLYAPLAGLAVRAVLQSAELRDGAS